MKKGKKFRVDKEIFLYGFIFSITLIIIWIVTYNVRSNQIDDEVKAFYNDKMYQELQGKPVKDVIILGKNIGKGKEKVNSIPYKDISNSDFKIGDTLNIIVYYKDGTKKEKEAYIIQNTDENEKEVQYQDGGYGQIIVPRKGA